jgi:subtilisin family serine protease
MRQRPPTASLHCQPRRLPGLLACGLAAGLSWNPLAQAQNTATAIAATTAATSRLHLETADKRSPQLAAEMRQAAAGDPVEAILRLPAVNLDIPANANRLQRLNSVVAQLQQHARKTQAALLAELKRQGLAYRSFWISNDIWVKAPAAQLASLIQRPEVIRAFSNAPFRVNLPADEPPQPGRLPTAIEWNVDIVNAPAVWALGYTGQGVVVGGQDTGYDWDHPALRTAYRGWDGTQANHNYNWHDAIHTTNGTCPANSPQPCDDYGHGTHTMGTIVGDDGQGNQVGVAPGARWIGCRNMNNGFGTPASYTECFQWFVAPTDLNNQNPDTTKAPQVINNSWGCVPSEGCTDPDQLKTVVDNVVAAGILVVVSAGNDGSACETVTDPPAIYASALTVGSTTSTDAISGFSSRGPVSVDGSGRLKPDISAPGSSVRSAQSGGGYSFKSGTSMASPNVSGVAALLLSAAPSLAGQPAALRAVLTGSASAKTTSQNCGEVPGSQSPNNTFGWGRIDALAAVQSQTGTDLIFANGFQ